MITNEEIMDVMRAVLKTDVDESTSQNNCEKWDSMNHLNLVIELEDTFEVEFEPNEISLMKSFSDIKILLQTSYNKNHYGKNIYHSRDVGES